jgi:hypothetical protein
MRLGNHTIPNKGDQVEQRRGRISRLGVVWYADQLQVLVKWQDGTSSSLRLGRDQFSIQTPAEDGTGRPPVARCRSLRAGRRPFLRPHGPAEWVSRARVLGKMPRRVEPRLGEQETESPRVFWSPGSGNN